MEGPCDTIMIKREPYEGMEKGLTSTANLTLEGLRFLLQKCTVIKSEHKAVVILRGGDAYKATDTILNSRDRHENDLSSTTEVIIKVEQAPCRGKRNAGKIEIITLTDSPMKVEPSPLPQAVATTALALPVHLSSVALSMIRSSEQDDSNPNQTFRSIENKPKRKLFTPERVSEAAKIEEKVNVQGHSTGKNKTPVKRKDRKVKKEVEPSHKPRTRQQCRVLLSKCDHLLSKPIIKQERNESKTSNRSQTKPEKKPRVNFNVGKAPKREINKTNPKKEKEIIVYACRFCNTRYRYRSQCERHLDACELNPFHPYRCPGKTCGKSFMVKHRRERHVRRCQEKLFVCAVCPKESSSALDIIAHMEKHAPGKPHQCAVCKKAYTCARDLRTHCETEGHRQLAKSMERKRGSTA